MDSKCLLPISHLAGSAMVSVPGTALELSPKAHSQREKRLKQQTHFSLLKSESSISHAPLLDQKTSSCGNQQNLLLWFAPTRKPSSELFHSNTRSSRTIRSFGWLSSSAKRLTWTASSFYRMVPKSVLPPHSVVRKRTSSLAILLSVASLATWATTARLDVEPSSPTSVLSAKTHSLLHYVIPEERCPLHTKMEQIPPSINSSTASTAPVKTLLRSAS